MGIDEAGVVVRGLYRREMAMPSAKKQIAKILQDQSNDNSYDESLLEVAFHGRTGDSDAGRTITPELGLRPADIKLRRVNAAPRDDSRHPSTVYFFDSLPALLRQQAEKVPDNIRPMLRAGWLRSGYPQRREYLSHALFLSSERRSRVSG